MASISVSHQNGRQALFSDYYKNILNDFTEWMVRLNYSKGSVRSRERHIKIFFEFIALKGIGTLEEVSSTDLDDYNIYLHQRPIAGKTIEAHISALKLLNQYRELYGQPPVMSKKLKVTKSLQNQRAIVSKAQANAMYEACEDNPYGWRDRVILALYYGCGLRYREGAHVEQRDVNFNTGLLHIRKGKNYRERYVPMSPGVMRELRHWIEHYQVLFTSQTNFILSGRNGKQVKSSALNNRLKKLIKKVGINNRITLHSLRHSIATHLMEEGMKLEDIGRFLGHATLETTQKYAHVVE